MLVLTDGSSEKLHRIGFVGEYGISSELPVAVLLPVPWDMKQTINSAELLAVVQALHLHSQCLKVAICADSECVLFGANGAAREWKARGWVGSSGPVSNVPQWEDLLSFLDDTFQDVLWVYSPLPR